MKLDGKVAIVVGTSPNIGGAIALGFAGEGARVMCVDRSEVYGQACARAIQKAGGQAINVVADATNEEQVTAAVAQARETYGGADILLNGVAAYVPKGVLKTTAEEFRLQMEVTLTGAFLFTKHVAQLMVDQGRKGNIINLISTEGHQGFPGSIGYGTAKSGLLNFTRSAAMELSEYGIRVNSLTPTSTDPAEGRARAAEWGVAWDTTSGGPDRGPEFTVGDVGVPLRRRPSGRHYAKAAVFLASDDAEMITGFDLRVDGGTIAKYWRWNPLPVTEP